MHMYNMLKCIKHYENIDFKLAIRVTNNKPKTTKYKPIVYSAT